MKKERQDAEVSLIRGLSRRALMKGPAVLAAGTAASALATSELIPPVGAQTTCRPYKAIPTVIRASPHKNVVETDSGKVYGYVKGGIVSCRGIPYRASINGKQDFLPPVKPKPWAGERSTL